LWLSNPWSIYPWIKLVDTRSINNHVCIDRLLSPEGALFKEKVIITPYR
jgi:hypothetical protein